MQEEKSTLNSFPETIDLNQGSFPNNASIDYPPSWDNMVNPVENRLPNYMFASSDENIRCTNDNNNCGQSFSGWESGESNSSTSNLEDQAFSDDPKTRLGCSPSPSFPDYFAANASSKDKSFEQSNIRSYVENQVDGESLSMRNYNSNCGSLNISSNHEHVRESGRNIELGSGPPHSQYPCSHTDTQHIHNFNASSSHVGSSVGDSSVYLENNETSGPCFDTWGTSCKRKAIEGTSGQSYHRGSSSSNQRMEDMMNDSVSGCYTVPGELGITSGSLNLSQLNEPEQLNPSDGDDVGVNRASPAFFLSSRIPTSEQCSAINFSVTSNLEHRQSDPLETSIGTSARHSSVHYSQPLSRPISSTNSLELSSPFELLLNPINIPDQSHSNHLNEVRDLPSHPWRESTLLDGGSSSSSVVFRERGSGANARSSCRTNSERPVIFPAPETRNNFDDQIDWSFAPGTSASPGNHSSGSRSSPSSGGPASSGAWLPHPNMASQSRQRLSEVAPWIPFLSIDSDSETQRSYSALFPSASSSSHEAASTSRAQHRSTSFLMDNPVDDTSRRHALATVERRHRLIHQVLNAMRRGVHLQAEDFMLIDPFLHEFVELHDRYRDMRVDVDNMSYEELLALEERIGNVSTGLDEEKILSSMLQKIYEATTVSPNLEPCCICQEGYVVGDGIGILDCGHEFHTICVKQWLLLKNICPVCKMTALGT